MTKSPNILSDDQMHLEGIANPIISLDIRLALIGLYTTRLRDRKKSNPVTVPAALVSYVIPESKKRDTHAGAIWIPDSATLSYIESHSGKGYIVGDTAEEWLDRNGLSKYRISERGLYLRSNPPKIQIGFMFPETEVREQVSEDFGVELLHD